MENKVLAVVNGREITETDLNANISRFPRERQAYFSTEEGKKQLLDQMVSFELIYINALEKEMDKNEAFLSQLELAKKELLTQLALNNLLSEVEVSEEEVKDYYKANSNFFVAQGTVSAKHILVETKEEAEKIKAKISEGMSFEDAAKEYSSCPSKAEGGNLGSFSKGQMVPEFEAAAYSLEIGMVSEPVETQFGFHLIKVEERNEGTTKTFDEVKEMIKNNILQERQNYKFMSTTEELKKKFTVEVL